MSQGSKAIKNIKLMCDADFCICFIFIIVIDYFDLILSLQSFWIYTRGSVILPSLKASFTAFLSRSRVVFTL